MRVRVIVAFGALVLAVSACEIRAEATFNPDGSGTISMVIGIDKALFALFEGQGDDPFEDAHADLAADPVDWDVVPYETDQVRGVRATFSFSSVEDLHRKLALLDESGDQEVGFGSLRVEQTDAGWTFESIAEGDPLGAGDGSDESPFDFDAAELFGGLDLQFWVTLPGGPVSHNADEVEQRGGSTTFKWKPPVGDVGAEDYEMVATTSPSAAGSTLPLVPLGVIGVLIALGGAFVLSRRNRGGAGAGAGGPVLEGLPLPAQPGQGTPGVEPPQGTPGAPVEGPPPGAPPSAEQQGGEPPRD